MFALIQTPSGPVVLAADDISHAVTYDTANEVHPVFAGSEQESGLRVHFKAKGSTHLDLPGVTAQSFAEALNGAPY